MTITLANGMPFAVGDKLSSATASQLDANTTYAVDKRATHSDTVQSNLTVTSPGTVAYATGSTLTMQSGAALTLNAGATATVANVTSVAGAGAKLQTNSSGRIELNDSDWPLLGGSHTGRTRTVRYTPAGVRWLATNWQYDTTTLYYLTSNNTTGAPLFIPFNPHNGSTITAVSVNFLVTGAGHGALPANYPGCSISRWTAGQDPGSTAVGLLSTGLTRFAGSGSVAIYENTTPKTITYVPDQNNIIDTSAYIYALFIVGESGANATTGVKVIDVAVTYSAIGDLRFP